MAKPADVKLLLVEDMRNILRRLLSAMGFARTTVAHNGEEALGLMQVQAPDLADPPTQA